MGSVTVGIMGQITIMGFANTVGPRKIVKLIGAQSNHSVEYFGGPAAPTHRKTINSLKMISSQLEIYKGVSKAET